MFAVFPLGADCFVTESRSIQLYRFTATTVLKAQLFLACKVRAAQHSTFDMLLYICRLPDLREDQMNLCSVAAMHASLESSAELGAA